MNYSQINTTQPARRENAVNGKSLLHFSIEEKRDEKKESERHSQ